MAHTRFTFGFRSMIMALALGAAIAVAGHASAGMDMGSNDTTGGDNMGGMDMGSGSDGMANGSAIATSPTNCPLSFPQAGLCGEIVWEQAPAVGAESKFQVLLYNTSTGRAEDANGAVNVVLWMPAMGHGSRPVTITHENGTGAYNISKSYFMMAGAWEIRVTIGSGAAVETATLPLSL